MDSDVIYVVPDLPSPEEVGMGANGYTENSLTGHDIPAVCGVYMITDTITGKTYVGSSKNIRTRMVTHFYCMREEPVRNTTYAVFGLTYKGHGSSAFSIDILEVCAEQNLCDREKHWIARLKPTENTQFSPVKAVAYTEEERAKRAERTRKLWATPEYRARAVAARKGNAYCKGYKCTPEQVQNRKRAGRISNMKRNYGVEWKEEYIRRYPQYAEDINA